MRENIKQYERGKRGFPRKDQNAFESPMKTLPTIKMYLLPC